MKLVYIAGSYRAKGDATVAGNIERAKRRAVEVCEKLGDSDWFPLTPHLNTAHFEDQSALTGISDEYWLDGTMQLMACCDAVLLVDAKSTTASSGTRAEIAEAVRLGTPVFGTIEELIEYVKR